jgi:hypothetical protein
MAKKHEEFNLAQSLTNDFGPLGVIVAKSQDDLVMLQRGDDMIAVEALTDGFQITAEGKLPVVLQNTNEVYHQVFAELYPYHANNPFQSVENPYNEHWDL